MVSLNFAVTTLRLTRGISLAWLLAFTKSITKSFAGLVCRVVGRGGEKTLFAG